MLKAKIDVRYRVPCEHGASIELCEGSEGAIELSVVVPYEATVHPVRLSVCITQEQWGLIHDCMPELSYRYSVLTRLKFPVIEGDSSGTE